MLWRLSHPHSPPGPQLVSFATLTLVVVVVVVVGFSWAIASVAIICVCQKLMITYSFVAHKVF